MFAPAASTHAFNRKQFWRLCSGPEPGTYSGKLRIWQSICVCLHTRCICCISMYCLFPWSMPGPAPWSHGICVTRVLLQYAPLISLFPKDMCRLKINDLTFQHKPFRRIAWTSLLPRAVEVGICKDSRRGLGILSNLQSRGRNLQRGALHVANTLIIARFCMFAPAASMHAFNRKQFWRLCSGPEPGTYSGKLRIW